MMHCVCNVVVFHADGARNEEDKDQLSAGCHDGVHTSGMCYSCREMSTPSKED